MRHEPHDDKTEAVNYRQDMQQRQEDQRADQIEEQRRAWAQRNGNDSGFDPYAQFE